MCNLDTFVCVQSPKFREIKFSFQEIYHKIKKIKHRKKKLFHKLVEQYNIY